MTSVVFVYDHYMNSLFLFQHYSTPNSKTCSLRQNRQLPEAEGTNKGHYITKHVLLPQLSTKE